MLVKIQEELYEVPDPVVKRMQEYYDTMKAALIKLEALTEATARMREMQIQYFKSRDSYLIPKSKALEARVDDLLAGKKKEPSPQADLFQ